MVNSFLKNKKNIYKIKTIIYVLILVYFSFLIYIAFQGVCCGISQMGQKLYMYIGNLFNAILLPGLVVFIYMMLFSNALKQKKLLKSYSIYMIVNGGIGAIGTVVCMSYYTTFGRGLTPFYPLEYLFIDILCILVFSIFLIKTGKMPNNVVFKPKVSRFRKVFTLFCSYLITFITLDRLGAIVASIFNGPYSWAVFTNMLPVYIISLSGFVGLCFYSAFFSFNSPKKKRYTEIIGSATTFLMSSIGTISMVALLFGSEGTMVMKIISPFYSLDRLASKPITMILISFIYIATSVGFMLDYYVRLRILANPNYRILDKYRTILENKKQKRVERKKIKKQILTQNVDTSKLEEGEDDEQGIK